jgi:protein-S-isoprenylcysteine O-methyltransferase Ste14
MSVQTLVMDNSAVRRPFSISSAWLAPRALDLAEKAILLVCYTYFLVPIVDAVYLRGNWDALLLAVSETLAVGLVIIRKPTNLMSGRIGDWALAFGATVAPTLVRPGAGGPGALASVAMIMMACGVAFQVYSKYTLGRRFGIVAANRGICDRGPYKIVRHPIYLGYFATHVGFLFAAFSWWNLAMYALTYALMIPRIFAEERLLRGDEAYQRYCQHVRWRLVPGLL